MNTSGDKSTEKSDISTKIMERMKKLFVQQERAGRYGDGKAGRRTKRFLERLAEKRKRRRRIAYASRRINRIRRQK